METQKAKGTASIWRGTAAFEVKYLVNDEWHDVRRELMEITLNISEELATRLRSLEEHLPEILELGLREFNASAQPGFEGVAEVIEILASLPIPEEILALRPSDTLQARISALLEKNRTEGLTAAEEREWAQYEYLEHVVRLAKARAGLKLKVS